MQQALYYTTLKSMLHDKERWTIVRKRFSVVTIAETTSSDGLLVCSIEWRDENNFCLRIFDKSDSADSATSKLCIQGSSHYLRGLADDFRNLYHFALCENGCKSLDFLFSHFLPK